MNAIFKNILDCRNAEYLILDCNFNILEISRAVNRFAHYPHEVVKGKDVRIGFPELIGLELQLTAILQKRQMSLELKGVARDIDKKSPWYIDIYAIKKEQQDQEKDKLIIFFEEVTQRIFLEQSLGQRTKEISLLLSTLSAAKDYINKIISAIAEALLVTTNSGEIKAVNRATIDLFGYSEDELINQPISMLLRDNFGNHRQQSAPLLGQGLKYIEVVCYTKTGKEIPVAFSCSAIETDLEELQDFVYIGRNISDRQRKEQESNLLQKLTQVISEAPDFQSALKLILAQLGEATGWNYGEAWILNANQKVLKCSAFWGEDVDDLKELGELSQKLKLKQGTDLAGKVWLSKQVELVDDIDKVSGTAFIRKQIASAAGFKATLGVPIIANDRVLAVLIFFMINSPEENQQLIEIVIEVVTQLGSIVHRKQTEDALRESEERFRLLLDGMKDYAIIMLDPKGYIISWNAGAERIHGYQAEEIINAHFSSFYLNEEITAGKPKQNLKLAAAEGRYETEGWRLRQDGTLFWAHVIMTVLQNPDGKLRGFSKITRDITASKLAEEALQRENLRSRLFSDTALKIRQSLQLEDILQTTVTEVREMLQADRVLLFRVFADGTGSVVTESVLPNLPILLGQTFSPEVFPAEYHHLYRLGRVQNIQDTFTANISPCHVQFLAQLGVKAKLVVPIIQRGNLWGLMIAHQCYVTRQWSSFEIELLQQLATQVGIALDQAGFLKAVQESEKQFRQLTENINEVFWMIAVDTNQMIYVSPAYEKVWGLSRDSLYYDSSSWLETVHLEDRDRASASFQKWIKGKTDSITNEYRIVKPDGSIRWIWARAFPIKNELGKVYRVAVLAEDITERKQVEQEIRKALEKEKELRELKSRFISMTSHEFRTPLSTILASSDLLKRFGDKLTEDKKLERLNKIQVEVRNMTRLLDNVLMIGKAEAGRFDFNPVLLNLEKFCRDILEEIELTAANSHSFVFSYTGDYGLVQMDEKLLRHIINNLLSNAVKYSPKGSSVYFDIVCEESEVILKIRDEGIGIPDADLEHLFEAFHRASNVGNIPGTGLGLSIIKNAIELHKGRINVESKAGVGTTFTVYLPTIQINWEEIAESREERVESRE